MMKKILFSSIFLLFILLVACEPDDDEVTVIRDVYTQGFVENPQVTTWQYGTHVLVTEEDSIMFALKSSDINLDDYIDQQVEIYGRLVEGYPVDTGPYFLNVLALSELDSAQAD